MKFKKEVVRKDDRSRAAVRRDVAAEQKAARAEALSEVLARFDMEEDTRDLQSALAAPAVACAAFQGPERLSVLDLLADPASIVDVGSLSSQELENVLDITATLQALQGFFKLPSKVHHLDDFLACIEAACASPPTSQSSSEVAAVKSVGANEDFADGAMEVTTSIGFRPAVETVEGEPEAETGHTAQAEVEPTGPSELDSLWESHREGVRAAEAELDRIQLNMLFPVVQELNSYLGLEEVDEKDAENRPRREKKNTLEHNSLLWSLPLNQLTFAELLRMCSIMRICQEMEKPIEETEYLLKGGQALQYTVAKNIARSIRYRMLVRSRLSAAFEEDPVLEASIISSDQVPLLPPSEFGPDDICDKLFAKDFSTEFLVCTDSPPLAFDGDDLSSRPLDNSNLSFKIGPVDFDFSSENDLIDSVLFAADGPESHIFAYNRDKMQRSTAMETDESPFLKPILNVADIKSILPGVYRRCCKVWIKLASMPFAKNFMWEVDKDMFPDYFQLLKNPMSLSAVAYRLSKMQYGDPLKNVRSAEEGVFMVASRFYKDVRSVCLNCITYNSEKEVLAGQASRMLMALHQHIVRWVLPAKKVLNVDPKCAISRPAINCCDEFHCLYTCKPIEQPTTQNRFTSIKCGRCSGVFSHSALKNYFDGSDLGQENEKFSTYGEACVQIDSAEGTAIGSSATVDEASSAAALSKDDPMKLFFIAPTDEIISQISEEWLCLLCLRDDFTGISENFSVSYCNTRHLNADSNFFIDEWGASTHMPWFLNPSVSNFASDSDQTIAGDRVIIDGSCGYGVIAKGVQIENLNDNVKYTLLSRKNRVVKDVQKSLESTVYPGGLPPPVLILQSCSRVLCDSAVSALLPQFTGSLSNATYLTTLSCGYKSRAYEPKSWSRTDRLVVLRGLCELIRNNAVVHEYLSKLNKDCEMLVKLSSPTGNGTSLPVEATFVEQCKCVAGDDGLTLFRRMMNRCGEGDDSDGYGDDVYAQNAVIAGRCYVCKGSTFEDDCPKPEDCVLLCDGCNAEAHLRCVSLGAVPSGDWYCESCSARIAARDNSDGASLDYLEEVNQFRSTDKEVGLLQNVIERREDGIRDLLHNHKGAPLVRLFILFIIL